MIATEQGRRIERARKAEEAEPIFSLVLRGSKTFAAKVRRNTELADRAWEPIGPGRRRPRRRPRRRRRPCG